MCVLLERGGDGGVCVHVCDVCCSYSCFFLPALDISGLTNKQAAQYERGHTKRPEGSMCAYVHVWIGEVCVFVHS